MRRMLIGMILMLGASPTLALAEEERPMHCASIDPDIAVRVTIDECTAFIQSGRATTTEFATAYDNRGSAYLREELFAQAIADFTTAIAINRDDADAYGDRAFTYYLKGDDAKALPDADRAVALDPAEQGFRVTRAKIYSRLGNRTKAMNDMRASLELFSHRVLRRLD